MTTASPATVTVGHVIPRARRTPWPVLLTAIALLLLSSLIAAGPARAAIADLSQIDGPSADIVGLDGVAMAADGSGGLVYRKRVSGRVHIFAARFAGGRWKAPVRVDGGQKFDSSYPAIGAGPGGRLVVTWCQQYGGGTQDRLFSAALDPGATGFQTPVPFDLNVGDGTDLSPSLSMNVAGQALLTYRVTTNRNLAAQGAPPGSVAQEIRLARYDGSYWTPAGPLVNRNPSQPMPAPTPDNGPKVAIDDTGNGLVAWQERDDELIPRVYARRVFSATTTVPLLVSPTLWPLAVKGPPEVAGGPALKGSADAISVSLRGLSEGAVAFRQQPSASSLFSTARIFVGVLPASTSQNAGAFVGPYLVDGGTDATGPEGNLGDPRVSVSGDGAFDIAVGAGTRVLNGLGDESGAKPPVTLNTEDGGIPPDPLLDRGDDGALAAAWKAKIGSAEGIRVLERQADGTPSRQLFSTTTGGELGPLDLSGSGLGDAAIAFQQGSGANTAIAATAIDAPPAAFNVATPIGWQRARRIPIRWDEAPSAIGKVTYTVLVDDQDVADDLTTPAYTLTGDAAAPGTHSVSVIATDTAGQPTTGTSSDLQIDRAAPRASFRVRGRALRITVSDGARRSGVAAGGTRVRFGDGRTGGGTRAVTHRFRRAGTYSVTVRTRDTAGNRQTIRRKVRVR